MEPEVYNNYSLILQAITAVGAIVFAVWQININIRLKKLQDYVAVTIIPMPPGDLRLQIKNVGKINLYLQKYEIGTDHESFAKGMLIPAGSDSFLLLPIKYFNIGQNLGIKLYLIDELGEKHISTGEAKVENTPISNQIPVQGSVSGQTQIQTIILPQVVAWAYKTIKEKWEL